VLAHTLARWSAKHGGALPRTYDEKKQFKAFVRETAWSGEEGNFDEAIDFAHRAYELPKFDRYVQAVFDDPAASDDAQLRASNFWLLVRAVREFIAQEGGGVCYPVSQNLPDMHCKTAYYVQLKQLFQKRAETDMDAVRAHVHKLLASFGQPADRVSEQELDMFVRNIRTLRVIRTRSLAQEYGSDGTSAGADFNAAAVREIIEEEQELIDAEEEEEEANGEGDDDEEMPEQRKPRSPNNVHWYLALRAADIFLAREVRAAGTSPQGGNAVATIPELEADFGALQGIAQTLVKTVGLSDAIEAPNAPTLGEVVRSANTEPHVTAAFLGGLAAQLGLKIILKQFVPLNHTVLWNGLVASSSSYQL
jgi:amyloid beta precursor protein binding protein 1